MDVLASHGRRLEPVHDLSGATEYTAKTRLEARGADHHQEHGVSASIGGRRCWRLIAAAGAPMPRHRRMRVGAIAHVTKDSGATGWPERRGVAPSCEPDQLRMARYPIVWSRGVTLVNCTANFMEFPVVRSARRELPGWEVDLLGEAVRLACVEAVVHQEEAL